jgi:hypothetical protein
MSLKASPRLCLEGLTGLPPHTHTPTSLPSCPGPEAGGPSHLPRCTWFSAQLLQPGATLPLPPFISLPLSSCKPQCSQRKGGCWPTDLCPGLPLGLHPEAQPWLPLPQRGVRESQPLPAGGSWVAAHQLTDLDRSACLAQPLSKGSGSMDCTELHAVKYLLRGQTGHAGPSFSALMSGQLLPRVHTALEQRATSTCQVSSSTLIETAAANDLSIFPLQGAFFNPPVDFDRP